MHSRTDMSAVIVDRASVARSIFAYCAAKKKCSLRERCFQCPSVPSGLKHNVKRAAATRAVRAKRKRGVFKGRPPTHRAGLAGGLRGPGPQLRRSRGRRAGPPVFSRGVAPMWPALVSADGLPPSNGDPGWNLSRGVPVARLTSREEGRVPCFCALVFFFLFTFFASSVSLDPFIFRSWLLVHCFDAVVLHVRHVRPPAQGGPAQLSGTLRRGG